MNILIVEDEPRSARLLRDLIVSVRPDAQIVGILGSIEETVKFLMEGGSPNLIFLDIELADGNSFEIFKQVSISAPVVFCTAYDGYMLEAFRSNGIAYLLKPIEEAYIRDAFLKLETITQALLPDLVNLLTSTKSGRFNSSFLVRVREKMVPIAVTDIAMVAFENEVPQLYTMGNEKYPLFKTMDEIEASLDPALFFRINRQMIINRRAITEIEPYFNRKVTLNLCCKSSDKPVVSRLKVAGFLSWIEK